MRLTDQLMMPFGISVMGSVSFTGLLLFMLFGILPSIAQRTGIVKVYPVFRSSMIDHKGQPWWKNILNMSVEADSIPWSPGWHNRPMRPNGD